MKKKNLCSSFLAIISSVLQFLMFNSVSKEGSEADLRFYPIINTLIIIKALTYCHLQELQWLIITINNNSNLSRLTAQIEMHGRPCLLNSTWRPEWLLIMLQQYLSGSWGQTLHTWRNYCQNCSISLQMGLFSLPPDLLW